ncbi:hypothetical protein BX600DRAFT_494298 [Xylariales sp. PMI_506]|nr:hypothetical protein BX600DRAFT_494298 [Xylariales sp. PMI_506]
MGYQYPPPSQSSGEIEITPNGYLSSYPTPTTSSMEGTSNSESNQLSASGKKRNKLGYHRASVACGMHGLVYNKIHSKGTQGSAGPGQKSDLRAPDGLRIASASSSPALPNGCSPDGLSQQSYSHMATVSPIHNSEHLPIHSSGQYGASQKLSLGTSNCRNYDYTHGVTSWIQTTNPHEMPVTPGYSSYNPHGHSVSTTWPTTPLGIPVCSDAPAHSEEMAWSGYAPHERSMSYGDVSSHGYTPTSHIGVAAVSSYDRKSPMSAGIYPPPMETGMSGVSMVPGSSPDPRGSISAGAATHLAYGW